MGQIMSDLSREQIEQKVRQLIAEEQTSLEALTFADLAPVTASTGVDLKSVFVELGSLKTEMKQLNRIESKRAEALKDFLESEKRSKEQLVGKISEVMRQNELLGLKPLVHSILELRDFVESFHSALPTVFAGWKNVFSFWKKQKRESQAYLTRNVDSILKKIDALLEKQDVFQVKTDSELFDPAFMTAVESTHDSSLGDNQVVETVSNGYVFNDIVIRYAKVKVNQKSERGEEG